MKKGFSLLLLSLIVLAGCNNNLSNSSQTTNSVGTSESNILVAYFSVTGNTKQLAEYAQEHLNSDLFEIVPSNPYTNEDINYNNPDSRANREQNDDSARPQIENKIENILQYDTIILGYPIWWGQAPKILYTFLESYDFSNKTFLPFCTSSSSQIRSSATNLANLAPNATWLEGRRFSIGTDRQTFLTWLDESLNTKEEENMTLKIDNNTIDVTWENNQSVEELNSLGSLTINMHRYGGFEQVGPIGQTITSNDTHITTNPGDIVLYSSNQIVIFYGSNSWSYTKLGHINMGEDELTRLLDKENIVVTIN